MANELTDSDRRGDDPRWAAHDAKIMENDAAILAYERSIGIETAAEVSPRQRRAYLAGKAAGIAEERERCARICDLIAEDWEKYADAAEVEVAIECATAIRALKASA